MRKLIAERAFDIVTEELQWTPDLPKIVLIDNTDIANGYATYHLSIQSLFISCS